MSEKNNDMPRLVKKIFIYSNGDTIERMYTGVPKKSPLVTQTWCANFRATTKYFCA